MYDTQRLVHSVNQFPQDSRCKTTSAGLLSSYDSGYIESELDD